ncbi:MAG: HDOD domain-containing protein [Candidatus Latescibacterota bacterium]|jgi:HD-like signal output (HDOD) protein
MAKQKIIALEGDPRRGALLRQIIEAGGAYEVEVSDSARALLDRMDGQGGVALILTNTRVRKDDHDGLRFIKALFLRYQGFQIPLPPIIVCSAVQQADVVKLYAFRFSELPLIYYVLIRTEELEPSCDKLVQLIEKSLDRRRELEAGIEGNRTAEVKRRLRGLLRQTVNLPQMPDVAVRVQQALRDPEVAFRKLAQVIGSDLTLAANVIKLANSPIYSVSGTIGTIEDACRQVGLRAIANAVVAAKVFDALETVPVEFDLRTLRRHCYAAASVARLVGRRCHALGKAEVQMQFSGSMFAAALLHDIGKVLLVEHFPEECTQVGTLAAETGCTQAVAEEQVVGVTHADAGLLAGIEWQFPVLLINVIGSHHRELTGLLARLKTTQGRLAQRVIRIADAAAYEFGFGMSRQDMGAPLLLPEYFETTGITLGDFRGWTRELKDDILYTFEVLGKV